MEGLTLFSFRKLSSPSSIRVIELKTEGTNFRAKGERNADSQSFDTIVCSIKELDLDDKPSFDALSYTWENAISVHLAEHKPSTQLTHEKIPILCDEQIMYIGENLHYALKMLRSYKRDVPAELIKSNIGQNLAQYMWIDQICIDQENVEERTSQVAIMHEIYRTATQTIIWLGPMDDFVRPALQALGIVQKWSLAVAKTIQCNNRLSSVDYARLGSREISDEEWICIYALFSRNWFSRVWVIQETTLSKNVGFMCGAMLMKWEFLAYPAKVLNDIGMGAVIDTIAHAAFLGQSTSGLLKGFVKSNKEIASIWQQPNGSRGCITAFRMILNTTNIRGGLGISDRIFRSACIDSETDMLTLLSNFRFCRSLDPRDKVFALIGILNRISNVSGVKKDIVQIDYRNSVEMVFLEAAWVILRSTKNLRLLSHVQPPSEESTFRLPSWVPDWSDGEDWISLDDTHILHGKKIWNASARRNWTIKDFSFEPALRVQGMRIGIVQSAQKYSLENLPSIHEMTCLMASFYEFKNSVEPVNVDESIGTEEFEIHQKAQKLLSSAQDYTNAKTGGQQCMRLSPSPRLKIDSTVATTNCSCIRGLVARMTRIMTTRRTSYQTRFEVLWRTIICDTWNGNSPAPSEAGLAFVRKICNGIKLYYLQREFSVSLETDVALTQDIALSSGTNLLQMLNRGEELDVSEQILASKQLRLANTLKNFQTDETVSSQLILAHCQADAVGLDGNGEDVQPVLQEVYIPVFDTMEEATSGQSILDDPLSDAIWAKREDQVSAGRSLFITEDLFGHGPDAIRPGDQLYVLAGADEPVILRQSSGGRHRLVGTAYAHGIMNGEIVFDENTKGFEELTLI